MVQKHLQWLDGEWLYWGPEFIAKACTKIQGQVTSGANSIAQRATITAVDADLAFYNTWLTLSIAVEI
jgi:hypothetical protein